MLFYLILKHVDILPVISDKKVVVVVVKIKLAVNLRTYKTLIVYNILLLKLLNPFHIKVPCV
jgi:hypothetical protein